jgi:hypothetical protein
VEHLVQHLDHAALGSLAGLDLEELHLELHVAVGRRAQ